MLHFNNNALTTLALISSLTICSFAQAGEYEGEWVLKDSDGTSFQAIFKNDGTASGTHGKSMKHGTWKEDAEGITIKWDTGWTTRITKANNQYIKLAFKPGASVNDQPTNTSDAVKVK
jgi:hypothetical protein